MTGPEATDSRGHGLQGPLLGHGLQGYRLLGHVLLGADDLLGGLWQPIVGGDWRAGPAQGWGLPCAR